MLEPMRKNVRLPVILLCLTGLALILSPSSALAVPSFARQTGMSCNACHTVWPELNHFGRIFKLDGYTLSVASPSAKYIPPIAAMFQGSYTMLNKNNGVLKDSLAPFADSETSQVAKGNLPQQASIFYGGRIIDKLGAFSQVTYSGPDNDVALDLTDVRYSKTTTLAGKHIIFGATVNNSPGVEDVWNNNPVWGFPYAASDVAPTPAASTLIDGGLDQMVGGVGLYASWADLVYGAVSVSRTTDNGITRPLGAGTSTDTVTDGAVPYWRLALFQQWKAHHIQVGTYGLKPDVYPGGVDSGPTDSFTDYAFDAQYQCIMDPHLFSLHATWIHEDQDWDASYNLGDTSNRSDTLKTLKIDAGYFYRCTHGTFGGYLGYFATTGDNDTLLYAPDPVDGSRTGSPDSKGFILEADWLFKDKYKFSAQYTIYDKFNGSSSNYDGFGRDASDNNTLYLLVWLMF